MMKFASVKGYQIVNGISYEKDTTSEIIGLLEIIRANQWRVRFHWGDTKTGRDWGDVYGVTGTIGNSMGPVKIPLLIYNRRCLGGGALLDDCIVKIVHAKGKKVIYQHPTYHKGAL